MTKDTTTDIDSLTPEQREAQLDDLELRDISDHKLRKVLRDLDLQTSHCRRTTRPASKGRHGSTAQSGAANLHSRLAMTEVERPALPQWRQ